MNSDDRNTTTLSLPLRMLVLPVRPQPKGGSWMAGFLFRLETADGVPGEPPTFESAIPNLRSGDTIPLGRARTLRVVGIRDDDADQPPVLVVEDEDGRISR
jgi:hypothetical protein